MSQIFDENKKIEKIKIYKSNDSFYYCSESNQNNENNQQIGEKEMKKLLKLSKIYPKIELKIYSLRELKEMCRSMNLKMNFNENEFRKFQPIIDLELNSIKELEEKALQMGLKVTEFEVKQEEEEEKVVKKRRKKRFKCNNYLKISRKRVKSELSENRVNGVKERQYWAESIHAVRIDQNMGELLFEIKWYGYESRDNSWQKINDLKNCFFLFQDFYSKYYFQNITQNIFEKFKQIFYELFDTKYDNEDVIDEHDFALILKLNSIDLKSFDRKEKSFKALKKNLEKYFICFKNYKKLEKNSQIIWSKKLFIQLLVKELNILKNFNQNLFKFFEFFDKRKEFYEKLKNWEKSVNQRINSHNFRENELKIENFVDQEIPPEIEYLNEFKFRYNKEMIENCVPKDVHCLCGDHCLRNRTCVCSLFLYKDSKRFKTCSLLHECNERCLCSCGGVGQCPNRRIQKGPNCHLIIFRTEDKGWGVMAGQRIPYKSYVFQYLGEVFDSKLLKYYSREKIEYLFHLDPELCGQTLFVDSLHCGNISRFANHSCEPNMELFMVVVDARVEPVPRIAFFANRTIEKYEEMTYSYGTKTLSFDSKSKDYLPETEKDSGYDTSSVKDLTETETTDKLKCFCGSKKCQKFLF